MSELDHIIPTGRERKILDQYNHSLEVINKQREKITSLESQLEEAQKKVEQGKLAWELLKIFNTETQNLASLLKPTMEKIGKLITEAASVIGYSQSAPFLQKETDLPRWANGLGLRAEALEKAANEASNELTRLASLCGKGEM